MSLENYTGNISDLVATNPTGTDPRSQGDDHLRGIKYTLKQSFPLATGPVRVSGDKLFAGDSATQANNFVIDASADNGTMRLARESGQDIMTVDAAGKVAFPQGGIIPSGAVMDFAMNSAPAGWLECDGAVVSRSTYAALFAAIGTTWGAGDGSTTFQLPDMRGYFRRGAGTNSDGVASGAFSVKQASANLSHQHTVFGALGDVGTSGEPVTLRTLGPASGSGDVVTVASGSTESRPSNIAVLTCIKT